MKFNWNYWKQNSSNEIENKIHQMKLKTKFRQNWKQNSNEIIENKIQTKLNTKFKRN
jgi:hypothetical protein